MAKEQWHRWGQTVVTIITLAFVCGITYSRIEVNTDDIKDVEGDVKVVQKDVHDLQISQQKDIALKESLLSSIIRIESLVGDISKEQIQIKLDVNSTKVKVNTLIPSKD